MRRWVAREEDVMGETFWESIRGLVRGSRGATMPASNDHAVCFEVIYHIKAPTGKCYFSVRF